MVRVGVERLAPASSVGQAEAVVLAGDRREVADASHRPLPVRGNAEEREDVAGDLVRVEPTEAGRLEVDLVERGLRAVDRVQVADETMHARMTLLLEQLPVERRVVVPLRLLRQLAAHEQE